MHFMRAIELYVNSSRILTFMVSVLRMALSQLVPKAAWGPPKPAGPYAPADDAWNTPYALYGSGRIEDPFFGVNLSGASDLELYLLLLGNARI